MKTIPVLFDIDGTLLLTGNAGMLGIERALFQMFAVKEVPDVALHGRTDYAIIQELFAALELSPTAYRPFVACYHLHLREALHERVGQVLPGVIELLMQLQNDERFELALLTGNSREAADLKLKHYDLDHYFETGGFGGWHADRDDVARQCWQAVRQQWGHTLQPERSVVVGDTPADIRCARAIGAKVIAVATGNVSVNELQANSPDLAVESLLSLTAVKIQELVDRHQERP